REVMERAAVGARTDRSRRQLLSRGFLRRRPGTPPVAAESLKLAQRDRAVDESAKFADRLTPESSQAPLGDQREPLMQIEAHGRLHQGECPWSLARACQLAFIQNPGEHVPVLGRRNPLVKRHVVQDDAPRRSGGPYQAAKKSRGHVDSSRGRGSGEPALASHDVFKNLWRFA